MSNYPEIKVPKNQETRARGQETLSADRFQKARKGSALPDPYRPRSYRERQTARKASLDAK